jgi:hypothetical protein
MKPSIIQLGEIVSQGVPRAPSCDDNTHIKPTNAFSFSSAIDAS